MKIEILFNKFIYFFETESDDRGTATRVARLPSKQLA